MTAATEQQRASGNDREGEDQARPEARRRAASSSLLLLSLIVMIQLSWLGLLGYLAWHIGSRLV